MDNKLNKDSEVISQMFNDIAPKYDFLNHLLSLNIDKLWRRRLVRNIDKESVSTILDIACGTGDLSILLAKKGFEVTGIDIAQNMLSIAESKSSELNNKPLYILASAESIPFDDNTFDAATISFGIRNFNTRLSCLNEIYRVLKDGASLNILEFAEPRNKFFRSMYLFYFKNILPLIGRLFSSNGKAYGYLPKSVLEFPQYEKFEKELMDSGFHDVKYRALSGGISVLYSAKK